MTDPKSAKPINGRRLVLNRVNELRKRLVRIKKTWDVAGYIYHESRPRTAAEYPENQSARWLELMADLDSLAWEVNELIEYARGEYAYSRNDAS